MTNTNIYSDIAARTGGDIYIGVVGPVRTGKSTFIKRFMDVLVLPKIDDGYKLERAVDELPQSAQGRTIMTTEPKFIPNEAVALTLDGNAKMRVRLVDCVGFVVPSALGYFENGEPRMVKTPWSESEMPFDRAAEIGTKKVMYEHSTIGLVVTTDGSISDIPRSEYAAAEAAVIQELKAINKPFVIILNCVDPNTAAASALKEQMEADYNVPVLAVNCQTIDEDQIREILTDILFEFPVREISVDMPRWIVNLSADHKLRSLLINSIMEQTANINRIRDVNSLLDAVNATENVETAYVTDIQLGSGTVDIKLSVHRSLFFRVLSEETGIEISGEEDLISLILSLNEKKKRYEKFDTALMEVEAKGYGIVMPSADELTLEEPEIIHQGGRYGVRLRASAPSIHMLRADIETEVNPIVGSEKQSEELVTYLLSEFQNDPKSIWETDIFGKSLHELVNEGLHNKLYRMPDDAQMKLQETLERIINEGCSGLICIIL